MLLLQTLIYSHFPNTKPFFKVTSCQCKHVKIKRPHQLVTLDAGVCFPPSVLGRKTLHLQNIRRNSCGSHFGIRTCNNNCPMVNNSDTSIYIPVKMFLHWIFSDTYSHIDYCFTGPRSHALCFYAVRVTHMYEYGIWSSVHRFYQIFTTRGSRDLEATKLPQNSYHPCVSATE